VWNKSKIRDFASGKYRLELDFIGYRSPSSRMKILAASMALTLFLLTSRGVSVANTSSYSAEEGIRRLNAEKVDAFLKNDRGTMARLWSDDFVVTNALNKFVTKQQVLGMVDSGFLVITSFDRQIEYLRAYGDVVIVAGREAVVWAVGCQMPAKAKISGSQLSG
jgi:hypothetical protein